MVTHNFVNRLMAESSEDSHSCSPPNEKRADSAPSPNVELSFYQRKLLQRVSALFKNVGLDVVLAALIRAQWSEATAIEELRRPAVAEATLSTRPVKDSEENDEEPVILRCADGPAPGASANDREKALEKDIKELNTLVGLQAQAIAGLESKVEKFIATARPPFSRGTQVLLPVSWCRQHLRPADLEQALRGKVFRPVSR